MLQRLRTQRGNPAVTRVCDAVQRAEAQVRAGWITALVALVACTQVPAGGAVGADARAGLIPTMDVRVEAGTVRMTLRLTNALEEAIELEFASAQRYDFQVRERGGTVLWTWSADRSFAQAESEVTVQPGETLEFVEVWPTGGRSGTYEAIGTVLREGNPISLATSFELGN